VWRVWMCTRGVGRMAGLPAAPAAVQLVETVIIARQDWPNGCMPTALPTPEIPSEWLLLVAVVPGWDSCWAIAGLQGGTYSSTS
jgi:hypothetical protein